MINSVALVFSLIAFSQTEADYKTQYCVRGGMPMDIQFILEESPYAISDFSLQELEKLAQQIEKNHGHLLRTGVEYANDEKKNENFEISVAKFDQFLLEKSSLVFNISFCGDHEEISEYIAVWYYEYFNRAVVKIDDELMEAPALMYLLGSILKGDQTAVANHLEYLKNGD